MAKYFLDLSPLKSSAAFSRLWASGLLTSVSSQCVQMALAWKIFEETSSSTMVGLLGLSIGIPVVLFSLFGVSSQIPHLRN